MSVSEVKRSTLHTLSLGGVSITVSSPESDHFRATFEKDDCCGTLIVKYDQVEDLIKALETIKVWKSQQIDPPTDEKE